MRLQLYEDGSVGYLDYDGDNYVNLKTDSIVVYTQGENEDRDEFIHKNGIKLKPNQYGSNEELDEQIHDEDWTVRRELARQGYGLDILVNDEDSDVRQEVAEQGYGLDKLVYDEDWTVREVVARQRYGLDILVNDKDWSVRKAVAEQGYGLDKLIKDRKSQVRLTIAEQGYGLDVLVNDEDAYVRAAVAKQGYGLDKLIKSSEHSSVREAVINYLKEHNLTIYEWKQQQDKKNVIVSKKDDPTVIIKDFIYKVDDSNKSGVQTGYNDIEEFFAEPVTNDTKLDILVICAVDTKQPLIKLEKVNNDDKVNYKFIVDITNENNDDFKIKTVIKTQDQLNEKIEQTIEALSAYPEFSKYTDDLENCL